MRNYLSSFFETMYFRHIMIIAISIITVIAFNSFVFILKKKFYDVYQVPKVK